MRTSGLNPGFPIYFNAFIPLSIAPGTFLIPLLGLIDPTGIAENNFANAISIYPNPNNGTFTLEMPTVFKGEFQLEVQNLIGQKVAEPQLKQTGNVSQVNLDHLPKGVYMLRVFNEEVSAVKKIVIE